MFSYIYKLEFETPVHFGAAELGGKLETISFSYSSDTLFSALCYELASEQANKLLENFITKSQQGKILLSDLLPYLLHEVNEKKSDNEKLKECYFYLPKPVLVIKNDRTNLNVGLDEVRKQATQRKNQKKMEYLRASQFQDYFSALNNSKTFFEKAEFGDEKLIEKVSCREEESLPYYVGNFSFNDNRGLYLIALFEDEQDAFILKDILENIGLTGIGGKRSSGYGKFNLVETFILSTGVNEDLKAIKNMLVDENANWQMSISSLLPENKDIPVLKKSFYRLKKRSGFVSVLNGEFERKKNSIYMLTSGSCFPKRIPGRIISLNEMNGHSVLRFGKGLYMGLPL